MKKTGVEKSIYVYENKGTKGGSPSRKKAIKRNRVGNPMTIGLQRTIDLLNQDIATKVDDAIRINLDALVEIRDNAVHYLNPTAVLDKQILEIYTASIRNFVNICKSRFASDFSNDLSLLMPLGFISGSQDISLITVSPDEKRLINYLKRMAGTDQSDGSDDYHIALKCDISFTRSNLASASKVVVVLNDPEATKVELSEEDIRRTYPWDYQELIKRLRIRYTNFSQNKEFYDKKRETSKNPALVKSRFLDPGNPLSSKKDFYNPNVLQYFDQFYIRK